MKSLKESLINESSSLTFNTNEYEELLTLLGDHYQRNKSDLYPEDKKLLKSLFDKIYKEAIKIDKEYFSNSSFGGGNIEKIDNRY